MKRYVYQCKKYTSEYDVREAIYEHEHLLFGRLTPEFMAEHGISEEDYNPEDEMSREELAEKRRRLRDAKLQATDKYLLPDFPNLSPEDLEILKDYRKALREVPDQEGFPYQINWPKVPTLLKG